MLTQRVLEAAQQPDSLEASKLVSELRHCLNLGSVTPPEPERETARQRAFALLEKILSSALREWDEVKEQLKPPDPDKNTVERANALARQIDHVSSEIYFASGACDASRYATSGSSSPLTDSQRRFYNESKKLISMLVESDLPSVTHHLLQTLELFIPVDPADVFISIGKIVTHAQRSGYQYESLAEQLVVKIVERYLADYRALFRENEECRDYLIRILSIFVEVGWPSAHQLTYRLEDIYR
jgi:hypothetical protein